MTNVSNYHNLSDDKKELLEKLTKGLTPLATGRTPKGSRVLGMKRELDMEKYITLLDGWNAAVKSGGEDLVRAKYVGEISESGISEVVVLACASIERSLVQSGGDASKIKRMSIAIRKTIAKVDNCLHSYRDGTPKDRESSLRLAVGGLFALRDALMYSTIGKIHRAETTFGEIGYDVNEGTLGAAVSAIGRSFFKYRQ